MRWLLLALLACAAGARAGSFGVTPTRLDFDRGVRSGLIEVSNDDERKLGFQARLYEWSQDADGKDRYAESQDLIFFPQIFTVNPGEKRVIRVGMKAPVALPAEKSYRLYIEEIPDASVAGTGTEVKVVLRFGVPIFVAPAAPKKSFALVSAQPMPGKVVVRIRNDGNQSAKFETLRITRDGATVADTNGWYVLAGATRSMDIPVDKSKCPLAGTLEVSARAEGVELKQVVPASSVLCARS
jgi:fimbrial chaperone protein